VKVPLCRPLERSAPVASAQTTHRYRASWSDSSGGGGGEQMTLLFSKHVGEWNWR
jgi:hypothetical protein